ncbi:MAG: FxsA family protein [Motiliproteus sp.]
MPFLLLLFILIPIIEITLLINVGQAIGAWYTVGLVLLSAFVGVNMLRQQGLSTLMRARSRMDSGEIPAQEMVEGIILAVGGALLITPGFVTDFFGFCCLIPLIRRGFVKRFQHRFKVMASQQGASMYGQYSAGARPDIESAEESASRSESAGSTDPFKERSRPTADANSKSGQTIDGEYRRDE